MVQVLARQVELPAKSTTHTHTQQPSTWECAGKVPFFSDDILHVIQELFTAAFTGKF